tara:strand:- start:1096 stop:1479 length:384 start_codon:yes stop_codon:yes gene_type:complete
MNEITLNASNDMHRKIADCFRGCRTTCLDDFVGEYLCEYYNRVEFVIHIPKENEFVELQQITLDLDKCQPCIYTAMKHGLRVEVEWGDSEGNSIHDFSKRDGKYDLVDWMRLAEIKSIKLLDMEGEG